jgi:L-asparaginase/Glu-tRNA(Gln) amidotransferase subunit D
MEDNMTRKEVSEKDMQAVIQYLAGKGHSTEAMIRAFKNATRYQINYCRMQHVRYGYGGEL